MAGQGGAQPGLCAPPDRRHRRGPADDRRGRPVLSPLSAAYRATVEQDRAEVMTAAGRPREAIRALEAAARAYGSRRLRTFQAECELTLAWTLLREDPARARVVARRAARHYRSQESPVPALRAEAAATVAEISAGGRTPALLRRAEELSRELRITVTPRRRTAAAAGRPGRDRPWPAGRCGRPHPWRSGRRALPHRHPTALTGGPGRARPGARGPAPGPRSRASGAQRPARVAVQLRQPRPAEHPGRPRPRPRPAGSAAGPRRRPAEPRLRVVRTRPCADQPRRSRALSGRPTGGQRPHRAAAAPGCRPGRSPWEARRVAELRARVRQRSWYGEGGGAVGEPARLDVLQDALAECDAALVAHLVVDDRVAAVVVTADDARLVELGGADGLLDRLDAITSDLTMAAAHRIGALASPIRSSLRGQLARRQTSWSGRCCRRSANAGSCSPLPAHWPEPPGR